MTLTNETVPLYPVVTISWPLCVCVQTRRGTKFSTTCGCVYHRFYLYLAVYHPEHDFKKGVQTHTNRRVIIPTLFPTLFEPFGPLPPAVGRLHMEGGCSPSSLAISSFFATPRTQRNVPQRHPDGCVSTCFLINAFFLKSLLSYLEELMLYYLLL
jgi:hypothetical protein